jgi:hypothetical protein
VTTHSIEDTGTFIVVDVGVQVVDTDGIDAHDLHEGSISETRSGIAEGIRAVLLEARAATGLIGNSNNLKLVAGLGVVELVALDLHRRNGSNERRGERDESRLDLEQKLVISLAQSPFDIDSAVSGEYKRLSTAGRGGCDKAERSKDMVMFMFMFTFMYVRTRMVLTQSGDDAVEQ